MMSLFLGRVRGLVCLIDGDVESLGSGQRYILLVFVFVAGRFGENCHWSFSVRYHLYT